MVAYVPQRPRGIDMHIVIIAWLFVTFTMALTMRAVAGIAFFVAVGLAPVMLYVALVLRGRRARRASGAASHADPGQPGEQQRGDDSNQAG